MTILLFEAAAYDHIAAGITTVRAASAAYNHQSAPAFYPGAILGDAFATATISRSVWQGDTEYGAGRLDTADIDVANIDGWLDWLVSNGCTYGYTGRLLLLPDASTSYASATALATGVIENAGHPWDRVRFRWRDQVAYLLDKAAQATKYAGNNTLPNGLEGVDDIKDQWKPQWWGTCWNVPLVCVNTSKLIHQASDRSMAAMTAVYDKGSTLTYGGSYATLADLQDDTKAPAPGAWKWYSGPEGTYVRLGTKPSGQVTADGSEGATAAARTIAQVWARLLASWGISTVSAADVAAADAAQPGEVGIWLGTDETQRRDVLNRVLASGGFVTWLDAGGTWRLARVEEPSLAASVATFKVLKLGQVATASDGDVLEWEWIDPVSGEGSPAYSVALTYARNWCVQSKDALSGVALEATATTRGLQWLSQETRTAKAEDAATLIAAPLARQTTEDTLFLDQTVAAAEAARRLGQRKKGGPRRARMKVKFGANTAAVVDLMKVITVQMPRYGMSAGRPALITRIDAEWSGQTAELYLYL